MQARLNAYTRLYVHVHMYIRPSFPRGNYVENIFRRQTPAFCRRTVQRRGRIMVVRITSDGGGIRRGWRRGVEGLVGVCARTYVCMYE